MSSSKKYQLHDVLMTDLKPLGCMLTLDRCMVKNFSRDYYKGHILFDGESLPADCISFVSGNVQISTIEGEKAEELYQLICNRQQKRRFFLAVRKLIFYLYYMASFSIGTVGFCCIVTLHVKGAFLAFFMLVGLRLLYTFSRNHIR